MPPQTLTSDTTNAQWMPTYTTSGFIMDYQNYATQYPKPTPKKEKDMSDAEIARAAVNKRKEEWAEKVAAHIDDHLKTYTEDGAWLAWDVRFNDNPDKEYHYVAVKGGSFWFITGDSTKYTHDALVTKVVELHLRGTVASGDWGVVS